MLNLIKQHDGIEKIYLYSKDLSKAKYEFSIKKSEDAGIKYLNFPEAFIECSNSMNDVYEKIDDYNATRKEKFFLMKWLRT